jgi:hypothetical protein
VRYQAALITDFVTLLQRGAILQPVLGSVKSFFYRISLFAYYLNLLLLCAAKSVKFQQNKGFPVTHLAHPPAL